MLLAAAVLYFLNVVLRFKEISDSERDQFSIQQKKFKREGCVFVSMLDKQTEYTNASLDDLEILKCQKPNPAHLRLLLLQRCILNLLNGIMMATAGLCLYQLFDFITFAETLENVSSDKQRDKLLDSGVKVEFAMERDARILIVVYGLTQLCLMASSALFRLLQGLQATNIKITNYSLIVMCISIVILCLAEGHKPLKSVHREVWLSFFIPAQVSIVMAYGLSKEAIDRQLYLVLGSTDILMSWSSSSATHHLRGGARNRIEQFKEAAYNRYLKYLR